MKTSTELEQVAEKIVIDLMNYDNMDFNDEERAEHKAKVQKVLSALALQQQKEKEGVCKCGHYSHEHVHYSDHDECQKCECDKFLPTGRPESTGPNEMFKQPPSPEWIEKHANDGPDVVGPTGSVVSQDTPRLDWLEAQCFTNREGEREIHYDFRGRLREAIDKAMRVPSLEPVTQKEKEKI